MKKKMISYIVPSLIASLFLGIYVLVDGAFIGSKMGDKGLSAINIAWPITAFIQTVGLAIGISGGIQMSIAKGKEEEKAAQKIFDTTILILGIIGVLFTIIVSIFAKQILMLFGAKDDLLYYGYRYLIVMALGSLFQVYAGGLIPLVKNLGKTKQAMFVSVVATIINFILDYLLIFVFEFDLLGAAAASIASQLFIAVMGFVILRPKLKFQKGIFSPILKGALAPLALNYSYSIIIILNNSFCLGYGDESAVAAYTLFSYLLYIVQASASGSGDGIQPLVSYYYGKKNQSKLKELYFKTLRIGFTFSAAITLVFLLLKSQIPLFYNLSAQGLEYYNMGFYYYFSAFFLLIITRINSCFLYASNNTKGANFLTLIEPLILTPILLAVFSALFKITGIFSSYLVIQIILLLISFIFIKLMYLRKDEELIR